MNINRGRWLLTFKTQKVKQKAEQIYTKPRKRNVLKLIESIPNLCDFEKQFLFKLLTEFINDGKNRVIFKPSDVNQLNVRLVRNLLNNLEQPSRLRECLAQTILSKI